MFKLFTLINRIKNLETRYQFNLKWLMNGLEFLTVIFLIPASYFAYTYIFGQIMADSVVMKHLGIYTVLFVFLWFVLYQLTSIAMFPKWQRHLSTALIFFRGYVLIFTILLAFKLIFNLSGVSLSFILIHIHLSLFITLTIRIMAVYVLRGSRVGEYNLRNIVVIGDACSSQIIDKFLDEKDWGFNVKAIISKSKTLKEKYGADIPILPGTDNLSYILESQVVDELIYCKKHVLSNEIRNISKLANEIGVVFRVQKNVSPDNQDRLELKTLNEVGKLTLVDVPNRKLSHDLKSMIDVFSSSVALILLSPVLLGIAATVKFTSKGPVFFAQERVGQRGRKFQLFKFRTMVVDAEKLLAQLQDQNEMDGPTFKLKDDPRITKIGKFLRKTGLDELPQLYNVVLGEMSLIGPRPPLESEVLQYERWQLRRLSVKPGITCTWQIMPNRNDIKFENWMHMDLNYIDNWSLTKDIGLIFKTISAIVFATGR